jgi:mRNA interferase MazF
VICESWSVVAVPFPFAERPGVKHRPALVLSHRPFNEKGHTVLSMITTRTHSPWPGDTEIAKLQPAGLAVPCLVRLKIFTLDNRLILRKIGTLFKEDRKKVAVHLRRYLI